MCKIVPTFPPSLHSPTYPWMDQASARVGVTVLFQINFNSTPTFHTCLEMLQYGHINCVCWWLFSVLWQKKVLCFELFGSFRIIYARQEMGRERQDRGSSESPRTPTTMDGQTNDVLFTARLLRHCCGQVMLLVEKIKELCLGSNCNYVQVYGNVTLS